MHCGYENILIVAFVGYQVMGRIWKALSTCRLYIRASDLSRRPEMRLAVRMGFVVLDVEFDTYYCTCADVSLLPQDLYGHSCVF